MAAFVCVGVGMQVEFARMLRQDATEAERRLWRVLRGRQFGGFKFRRQHPIGPFVADFACVAARLIVEADGGQHVESVKDDVRTRWLEARGWHVVRFWNHEILADEAWVREVVWDALTRRDASLHDDLSRKRER